MSRRRAGNRFDDIFTAQLRVVIDAAVSAALNFQNGSMAAAQLSGMMPPMNGKDDRYGSDREDEGELGSDAENDDMSDNEDIPSSTALSVPINNGDHN